MENINAGIIDMQLTGILKGHAEWFDGYKTDERKRAAAFVLLCMSSLLGISQSEAVDMLTDGGNDAGVDGIYVSEVYDNEFTVTIFQGKYKSNLKGDATFPENGVQKSINTIQVLFNPRTACDFNPKLRPKVEEIRSLIGEGSIPKVRIVLCNNGLKWNEQAQSWIDDAQREYRDRVEFCYYNHDSIVSVLQKVKSIDTPLTLSGKYMIEDMNCVRVFTGRISVQEIAALFDRYGDSLLQRNVRRYLGLNDNRVNSAIQETLSSDKSDRFYFYNNGITAVCDRIDYNAFQKDDIKVNLKNFQIINGGQTCKTIQKTLSGLLPGYVGKEAYVMIRIYQVSEDDKALAQDITFATNNQNPVDLLDLHSNDAIQYELEAGMKSLGYQYRRQRGVESATDHVINSHQVAEAVLAVWRRKPHLAKFRQKDHFGSLYHEIFDNLNAAQAVLAVKIYQTVETKRKQSSESDFAFLAYASYYLSMVVGDLLLADIHEATITPGKFLAQLEQFESNTDAYYTRAVAKMDKALKTCYGNRTLSLQQLSAAFRRNDLIEMLEHL